MSKLTVTAFKSKFKSITNLRVKYILLILTCIPSIKYLVFLKIRLLNLISYILQQFQFTHKFEQNSNGLKVVAQDTSVAIECGR